eukprot:771143_1
MSKCTPCAEGTSNDKTGQEECPKCKVGHFSGAQAATCTQCAKNTFANVEGSSECTDCPEGQASKPGQKECGCADADHGVNESGECAKVCEAGHFASDGGTCTLCEAGTANPNRGSVLSANTVQSAISLLRERQPAPRVRTDSTLSSKEWNRVTRALKDRTPMQRVRKRALCVRRELRTTTLVQPSQANVWHVEPAFSPRKVQRYVFPHPSARVTRSPAANLIRKNVKRVRRTSIFLNRISPYPKVSKRPRRRSRYS